MTPEQISNIRASFALLLDRQEAAGKVFYERLFAIAPDTRTMFPTRIDAQARKLMDTLSTAIGALREPGRLQTMLAALGQRHAGYGVKDEHYERVGEALLWTLDKELGAAFTPATREAWTNLYGTVAAAMKAGGRPAVH